MSFVHRIFVEKKPGFDVAARSLLQDLKSNLGVSGLEGVRLLIRYDVAGLTNEEYQTARNTIFAEPPVDYVYDEQVPIAKGETVFAIEYLPGQYDQRADSAAQCIQVITHKQPPAVNAAQVLVLRGKLSKKDLAARLNKAVGAGFVVEAPDGLWMLLSHLSTGCQPVSASATSQP